MKMLMKEKTLSQTLTSAFSCGLGSLTIYFSASPFSPASMQASTKGLKPDDNSNNAFDYLPLYEWILPNWYIKQYNTNEIDIIWFMKSMQESFSIITYMR
jgi:hypothetical protein